MQMLSPNVEENLNALKQDGNGHVRYTLHTEHHEGAVTNKATFVPRADDW